jgi:dienelactone hydrolase
MFVEEIKMKSNFAGIDRVVAFVLGALIVLPSFASGQTAPPIGGGYKDVVPIPVDDPTTKAIAGALFKPTGKGPFPVVVYMSGCYGLGLNNPPELVLERTAIDHLLAKGVATFIVDPFTPRNEPEGVCAKLNNDTLAQYFTRGGNDAVAALKVVKSLPDIDPNRVFLQGYSFGAISSLFAVDPNTPGAHDAKIAGLIAYFPYCYDNVASSVPTLVLIGEKDDWTPAALCQKVSDKPNFEVAVFPDSYHGFVTPMGKAIEYLGHHIAYNEKTALDAQVRADAFLDAHLK